MSLLTDPSARLASLLPTPRRVVATDGVCVWPERPTVALAPGAADADADTDTGAGNTTTDADPDTTTDATPDTNSGTDTRAWTDAAILLLGSLRAVPGTAHTADLTLLRDPALPEEGYTLDVTPGGVRLAASTLAGVRHGVQTLRQLFDPAFGLPTVGHGTPRVAACCSIDDAPAWRWRGAMVDVARHVAPLPWLFGFVDQLAAHKLTTLHLHLTDDQGWRFEVPAYPRLTEVGAHRPGTRFPGRADHDGVPHGGFYTQAQLRALVAHAAERGVTVVPEIDVPGHVRALLAAYPEYGWGDGQPIATHFDVFPEVLWPDDRAVALVEHILTDVLAVFDSEYIHIGGDECPKAQWRGNTEADALAASRGLPGPEHLQRWFTSHLRDFLAARGRRVVGWDEILSDGDVPGAVVMSWRGTRPGREALARGYEVVMTPSPTLYFDSYQSDSPAEPFGREPVRTWADVVAFDPAEGVPDADRPRLLGVQGQAWAEFLVTTDHREYMTWPRLSALAEVGWHGPADPAAFEPRLRAHLERLDAVGVAHRPLEGPRPWQTGGTGVRKRVPW